MNIKATQDEFTRQAEKLKNNDSFRNDEIIKLILRSAALQPQETVLDLACGPGIVTAALAPLCQNVYGLDLTPKMVEMAIENCRNKGFKNVKIFEGRAERTGFADNFFDCIVTRLAVHHFENPETVFKEIERILKPGGRVVAADIFSSRDPAEAELQNAIEYIRDPSHTKCLCLEEFDQVFDACGFVVEATEFYDVPRNYDEWLEITNSPERYNSLEVIIRQLIEAGKTAGMEFKIDNERISFIHKWVIFRLRKQENK